MLDPLTALSLAGTVVQFIDFATKVAKQTVILTRRDGSRSTVATELTLVCTELQNVCTKLDRPLEPRGLLARSDTKLDESLAKLCRASNSLANEMLVKLKVVEVEGRRREEKGGSARKLRRPCKEGDRPFSSLVEAIKMVWNEKALSELNNRLSTVRETMELHVVVALSEKLDIAVLKQSRRFDSLDLQTQSIITAIAKQKEKLSEELKTETQRCQDNLSLEIKSQTLAISQMMSRLETKVPDRTEGKSEQKKGGIIAKFGGSGEPDDLVDDLREDEQWARQAVEKAVLDDLRFSSMEYRKEEVAESYPNTFEWIFESIDDQEENDEVPWSNFADWLSTGSGIYWINGKAASGKSTLMRYICESPQTSALLKPWAGPIIPTIAEFFFWNSGTLEQRSQQGLLRTVLFEILQEHRELIPMCLPPRWAKKYSEIVELFGDRDPKLLRDNSWTLKSLMDAFKILLEQTEIPMKLCLFIDGLDEYEGDYDDIVKLFKYASSSSPVKVCLSSRPLLAFEDAFGSGNLLRLQDLTYSDIEHYVSSKLSSHSRYHQVLQEEPIRGPKLIQEIVQKADGVFLWVVLVVQSLLSGFGNRDSIKDLQRRLRLLPGDLEALFSHMFKGISPFYKAQASEYFQLVQAARHQCNTFYQDFDDSEPLTLIELSLADDDDPDLAVTADIRALGKRSTTNRCDIVQARLKVRCLGLLEVHSYRTSRQSYQNRVDPFSRIQYLHRTARDYIERPDVWASLVAETKGTGFNPHLSLLRACILQLKWQLYYAETPKVTFDLALSYAQTLERTTGEGRLALIDELDRSMRAKIFAVDYSSFMIVAKEHTLHAYIWEKEAEENWPTLGRVINSDIAVVEAHLNTGADPNEEYRGTTPWKELLRNTNQARYLKPQVLDVIHLFLRHGADITAKYLDTDCSFSASAVISKKFGMKVLAGCPRGAELLAQRELEQRLKAEQSLKKAQPGGYSLFQLAKWFGVAG